MSQDIIFTSPRQKFLHDLLFEKDQHLYDLYTKLEQILPPECRPGNMVDKARKRIKAGKSVKFLNDDINKAVAEAVRTEDIIDALKTLLEESGVPQSSFVPRLIGPRAL